MPYGVVQSKPFVGTPVDFSSGTTVQYQNQTVIVSSLNSGLGAGYVSQYLYPAMPRNLFAFKAVAKVDTQWDGRTSIQLWASPGGAQNGGVLPHNRRVKILSNPQVAAQGLWYRVVATGPIYGWIRSEYLRP
jgi:hypothetical protein